MLELWVIDDIQIIAQLLIIDVWNNHKQKKEHKYIGIEEDIFI